MKKLRIVLIFPMMLLELCLVILIFVTALVSASKASKINEYCVSNLPDRDWYFEGFN